MEKIVRKGDDFLGLEPLVEEAPQDYEVVITMKSFKKTSFSRH